MIIGHLKHLNPAFLSLLLNCEVEDRATDYNYQESSGKDRKYEGIAREITDIIFRLYYHCLVSFIIC